MPGLLYGTLNVGFDPEWTRDAAGEAFRNSGLSIGGAVSYVLFPGTFIGVETRYERTYTGLGLDTFDGDAFFVGPTLYMKLAKNMQVTAAWNAQVYGHASGETGRLNLTDFERNQALLRLSFGLD